SEMGPGADDIAQVGSEVKVRLPGLPAPPVLEPEQARFRLFASITTFMKNASKDTPLMVVLDDMHWADKPSLLLLQFLAKELRGSRLMVLGTYRDVELRRQHPLAQTLGELNRENLSQRVLLRGLTENDLRRFVEVTAGTSPPDTLVKAVYKETEGSRSPNSRPITEPMVNTRLHSSDRWSSRRPTTSFTLCGIVTLHDETDSACSKRPSATSSRTISLTKNGLPSVSLYTAFTSVSGGEVPAVTSTNLRRSFSVRPRSSTR